MDTEPVDAGVVRVTLIGEDLEGDDLENLIIGIAVRTILSSLGALGVLDLKLLDGFAVSIIGESSKNNFRVSLAFLFTYNDKISRCGI